MQALVETSGVQFKVDDDFTLGPIDFHVEPGTITALIGNNGSGKSTLLKLLLHLAKADAGTIKIGGKPISVDDERWKSKIAYQPQTVFGCNPFTGETLREMTSRWYPNWDEALFRKIVYNFNVPVNKRFSKLSQGSQQKLMLALTIARGAPLLILDEPTNFLDIPSKKALIDILIEWMDQEGRAIIIASHQADDIQKLADYLAIVKDGNMLGVFEKEELRAQYRRYWMETLPEDGYITGEVYREARSIVTDQPAVTEDFLRESKMSWTKQQSLTLDEVISLLLGN